MRFSILAFIAFMGVVWMVAGVGFHSLHSAERAGHGMSMDVRQTAPQPSQWMIGRDRAAPPDPGYVQTYQPPAAYSQQDNSSFLVNYHEMHRRDDWAWFPSLLIMLGVATMICRWIFRSTTQGRTAIRTNRVSAWPPKPVQPPRPVQQRQPPPIQPQQLNRICSRADCGRVNPPEAQFCRRCGATLADA